MAAPERSSELVSADQHPETRKPATIPVGAEPPAITLQPTRGFSSLRLADIWEYRELLYFMIWRDVKVRYKQTAFGAAWAIFQPAMLMVVFTVFLNRVAGIASYGIPYPVFAAAGLVPWTLFSQGLLLSSSSLVDSAPLIGKVYFPRLVLPIAAACSFLLDYVIALGLLAVLMAVYGVAPGAQLVLLPVFTLLVVAVALSVGIWLSALNVRYRDVRYTLPFLVQLWLLVTPIAYASSRIPSHWRTLMGINPVAGALEGFRWCTVGTAAPSVGLVTLSFVTTVFLLVTGLFYFRRVERTFADVI
jgi:lipopolysaccharide transport system permease protein